MLHKQAVPLAAVMLATGAVLTAVSPLRAEGASNASLKGKFPFNETLIVAAASPPSPGFCPTDPAQLTVTEQLSISNQGTWSFDGIGHVHIEDTGVLVTLTPGAPVPLKASFSQTQCDGTYQVQSDSTVDMNYICSVPAPGGQVQFDIHAKGVITPHIIQVAVPPAVGQMHFASGSGRVLIGCEVVGENTTIVVDRNVNQ